MALLATEAAVQAQHRPISTIVFIVAMKAEAAPILKKFGLSEETTTFPRGVPWVRYHGIYENLEINVIWPGQDPLLGVNNIGTISAALVTYASALELKPDLIINAGTAGGFGSEGACVGDVFLVSHVAFNHRRIPLPGFNLYGIGLRQAFSTPLLLKDLNLKDGKLSTGDSFDTSPEDDVLVRAVDATLIDMEGAAVSYVADLLKIPAIFLKAVTNIVDTGNPSVEEFHENLPDVSNALSEAVGRLVSTIKGSACPSFDH